MTKPKGTAAKYTQDPLEEALAAVKAKQIRRVSDTYGVPK